MIRRTTATEPKNISMNFEQTCFGQGRRLGLLGRGHLPLPPPPKEGSAPPDFLKIIEKLISFKRYVFVNLGIKLLSE